LSTNPLTRNTYDLPGGAKGSLETGTFSLAGSTRHDKPTLYFNYFLQTQGASGTGNTMRDSARVFISEDGGITWEMVATNNSSRGGSTELPQFASHNSTAAGATDEDMVGQQVQELFDTANWRQARVDLSKYAGQPELMLRFDF